MWNKKGLFPDLSVIRERPAQPPVAGAHHLGKLDANQADQPATAGVGAAAGEDKQFLAAGLTTCDGRRTCNRGRRDAAVSYFNKRCAELRTRTAEERFPALQLYLAQPQSVADHRDRAEAHGCSGDDGAQQDAKLGIQNARRNGDAHGVVDEREK